MFQVLKGAEKLLRPAGRDLPDRRRRLSEVLRKHHAGQPRAPGCCLQSRCTRRKESRQLIRREWRRGELLVFPPLAGLRAVFFRGLSSGHDRLGAIGEPVNFGQAARPPRVFLESTLNPRTHCLKRNTRLFPCLDKRPVERRQQRGRAAAALVKLFDFREVVEIVLHP